MQKLTKINDFIDTDFRKFDDSINYLINKGNSVIRVTKQILSIKINQKYFLTEGRTDSSDVFFISIKIQYFGSYNGITNLSAIFRKKLIS